MRYLLCFFLCSLFVSSLQAQEPKLHPTQMGLFGAGSNAFFMSDPANAGGQWASQGTAQSALNYWTLSGSDVYRGAGKVGVNTATINSDYNLHVAGAGLFESSAYKALRAGYSTGGWIETGLLGQAKTGMQYLTNAGAYGDFLLQPNGGNVAIGQASAAQKLDVNGNIRALTNFGYTGVLTSVANLQLGQDGFGLSTFNNGNTVEMVFLTYGKVPFSVNGYGGVSSMIIRNQTDQYQSLQVTTRDNTVPTNASLWWQARNDNGQILSWNQPGGLDIGTTSSVYPLRLFAAGNADPGIVLVGSHCLIGTDTDNGVDEVQVSGSAKITSTLRLGSTIATIATGNGNAQAYIFDRGTFQMPTTYSSDPSGIGNGDMWENLTSGDHRIKFRANDITQTVASREVDLAGNGTFAASGAASITLDDTNRNLFADANANNVTLVGGTSMDEGVVYRIKCRRNTTNTITLSASGMGGTIEYDGGTTIPGPTTLLLGNYACYDVTRIGSVLWVKKG